MTMPIKARPAGASGGRGLDGHFGEATSRLAQVYPEKTGLSREVNITREIRLPTGQKVGEVQGDCLVKKVRGSVHQLRQPPAWAVDVSVLRQAEALGAKVVKVEDTESGIAYSVPLSRFWTRGVKVSRGYGDQLALVLSDWQVNGAPSRADAMPVQLPLFGQEVGL